MGDYQSGDLIEGRYRVIESLGTGSAGQTWSAEEVTVGTRVAIKRFQLKGAESWKSLQLFEREAKVLATLDHPDIPRFVESFSVEGPDGPLFFIVQALVPGPSLAAFVRERGVVGEAEARRIADRLLIVLAYIHALAPPVIHRDLKPANVVRRPDGSLALVDFGAVRVAAPHDAPGTTVVGTFGFMAPEQFRGAATAATDLYSLGATLVFVLTGQSPDQLPQKKLRAELPRALNLTKPFQAWLEKLLEPAPEDRFASAGQALTALRTGKIDAPKRSSARVVILGGVLALAVAGGGAFVYWDQAERAGAANAPGGPQPLATPATSPLGIPGQLMPIPERSRRTPLREEKTVRAHDIGIHDIVLSPDGKLLASTSHDGAVKLWSTATWSQLVSLPGAKAPSTGVAFSPDGSLVAASDPSGARIWDTKSYARVAEGTAGAKIHALTFSPDGKTLLGAGEDGNVHSWPIPAMGASSKEARGIGALSDLELAPSGDFYVASSQTGAVARWPAAGAGPSLDFAGHSKWCNELAVSFDSKFVAASCDDGYTSIWFTKDAHPWFTVRSGGAHEAWASAFSPDGKLLATSAQEDEIQLWTINDARFLGSMPVRGSRGVRSLTFTPDSTHLVAATITGFLIVFELTDSKEPPPIPTPPPGLGPDKVAPGAPASERARLLTASYNGNPKVLVEALALCDEALAANPHDVASLVQRARAKRARAMHTSNDYDLDLLASARADLDQALTVDPTNVGARAGHVWIALFEARTRAKSSNDPPDLAAVHAALDALDTLNSHDFRVDEAHAEVATQEGRFDDALQAGTRMVTQAKNLDEVDDGFGSLRETYTRMHWSRAADALWQKHLEAHPGSAWTLGNYASFLYLSGDTRSAMQSVDAALRIMNYGVARGLRADLQVDHGVFALWDKRDAAEAKELFEAALKDDASDPGARYGLIAVDWFVATGKNEKCDDCVERLKELAKKRPDFTPAKSALTALGVH